MSVTIAIATCAARPPQFDDDELLERALAERGVDARSEVWDDATVDWDSYALVVIRSTWDYARRRDEFLRWAAARGERLRNRYELVRWNTDKRYLADLAAAGLPVVPTTYVEPGEAAPTLEGEVAVKPAVSAGGRDTGRFRPAAHGAARELIARITGEGRTAMVRPYLASVDAGGEAAIAFVDGELSHVLRKRAVLTPDREAPVRDDPLGAAEAMYDPDLVTAAQAGPAELDAAAAIVAHLAERFGSPPLYARVDLVGGPRGDRLVLELEAVEPSLYLALAPGAAGRLADAILASLPSYS